MNNFLEITFDKFGITFSTQWLYFNLSWKLILTSAVIFGIVRVVKLRKNKKVVA